MKAERIKLEKYSGQEDFPLYSCLVYNDIVMNMNMGRIFTKEEAEEHYGYLMDCNEKYEFGGSYKVFITSNNTYIGSAILWINEELLSAEVEYMILPAYWGNGYATEVVKAILEIVNNYESIKEVKAITNPTNLASKKVLIKNGFVCVETFKVEENNSLAEIYKKITS